MVKSSLLAALVIVAAAAIPTSIAQEEFTCAVGSTCFQLSWKGSSTLTDHQIQVFMEACTSLSFGEAQQQAAAASAAGIRTLRGEGQRRLLSGGCRFCGCDPLCPNKCRPNGECKDITINDSNRALGGDDIEDYEWLPTPEELDEPAVDTDRILRQSPEKCFVKLANDIEGTDISDFIITYGC